MNIIAAQVMYRNPMEQWFWESGAAWWFYGGIAIFAMIFYITHDFSGRKRK